MFGAGIAAGLVLTAPAGGALEVRLAIVPARPAALESTQIVLRTYLPLIRADGSCCRLEPGGPRTYPFRVEAVSPAGKMSRVTVRRTKRDIWGGLFRFPISGRWTVRVANYGPSYRRVSGALPRITVDVRVPRTTAPPAGFGSLGRPGCDPASPVRDPEPAGGFREIFGTALGGEQLWALPFLPDGASWARFDRAEFDGLVGKEVKIVFAMTSYRTPFGAIGPDGAALEPAWVSRHLGANFARIPGPGWGAGFVFPEPGCWRIRAGSFGDVWLLLRS